MPGNSFFDKSYKEKIKQEFYCKIPKRINPKLFYNQLVEELERVAYFELLLLRLRLYLKDNEDSIAFSVLQKIIREPENVKTIYAEFRIILETLGHPEDKEDTQRSVLMLKNQLKGIWERIMSDGSTEPETVRSILPFICVSNAQCLLDIVLNKNPHLVKPEWSHESSVKPFSNLYHAISYMRVETVRKLLEAGIEEVGPLCRVFDKKSTCQDTPVTPLYLAIEQSIEMDLLEQGREMVNLLLAHGADPDQRCGEMRTPRELAMAKLSQVDEKYIDFLSLIIEAPSREKKKSKHCCLQ